MMNIIAKKMLNSMSAINAALRGAVADPESLYIRQFPTF